MSAVLDAQIARLRALAADDEPKPLVPASDALEASPGASEALISNNPGLSGQFPYNDGLDHAEPYLGPEFESYKDTWPRPEDRKRCGAPYRTAKGCGCGVTVVRDHCDKISCGEPYCEEKNRKRRAMDLGDRIEANLGWRWLIYTILTVPPERRAAAADKKTWQKWLQRLARFMRKELKAAFICERSDPAGTDLTTWHPHANLLWARTDGRGMLSRRDLERLRYKWSDIIGATTKRHKLLRRKGKALAKEIATAAPDRVRQIRADIDGIVEELRRAVVIYTHFARPQDKAKREFWYSYQGRPWPTWAEKFAYHVRVKWFGKPEPAPEREHDRTCEECGKEIVAVRCGSEEAASALALRGYEHLKLESDERLRELKRMSEARKEVPFRGLLAYAAEVSREGG